MGSNRGRKLSMYKLNLPETAQIKIGDYVYSPEDVTITVDSWDDVSDGYHTFHELYEHRCLLFLAFLEELYYGLNKTYVWKSKKHDDGSSYDGWFIAGATLSTGKQITYHLPDKYWNSTSITELEKAPKWDGHTSNDVVDRLKDYLGYDKV